MKGKHVRRTAENPTGNGLVEKRSGPVTADGRLSAANVVFTVLTSLVLAFYLELFREATNSFRDGDAIGLLAFTFTPSALIVIACAFVGSCALLLLLRMQKGILNALFTWRYPIALVLLVGLVVAGVSGSSLALWGTLLDGSTNADLQGVLLGIPRSIRSDEFAVFTPMAFSQSHNAYASISEITRGVPTDLTLIYAQPSWALSTVFRPFLWGYLVLGSARGLSFFWYGRAIALFLVSFEFGRFITRDNRSAALAYALLVSLSPIVQWWFSVNGTVELLVFSQGGILAFGSFLRATSLARRVSMAALAAYAAGCFVMIIYPAWQVSFAYVIVAFCIADVVYCRMHDRGALARGIGVGRAFASYWLVLLCMLAVVFALIGVCLMSSQDVIQAVGNTAYPGKRVETGGGLAPLLFDWVGSWLYPLAADQVVPNACERASAFTLFPLGALIGVAALVKRRDPYLIALFVAGTILLAFGLMGFPEWLAKVTLLSNVTTQRLVFALGVVNIVLLVRGCAILNESANEGEAPAVKTRGVGVRSQEARASSTRGASVRDKGASVAENPWSKRLPVGVLVAFSVAFGVFAAFMMWLNSPAMAFTLFLVLAAVLVALATFAALSFAAGRSGASNLACVAVVLALAGLCVNPLQQGVSALEDNAVLQEAAHIVEQEPDAVWAGSSWLAGQALITTGAHTISSVAIYPDLNTWQAIDPTGTFEDTYNRYAHIAVNPTQGATSFTLEGPDSFAVDLNANDTEKLGIDYWLAEDDLTRFNTDRTTFKPCYTNGLWTIFHVEHV